VSVLHIGDNMTTIELIEHLKQCDPDAEVLLADNMNLWYINDIGVGESTHNGVKFAVLQCGERASRRVFNEH
jgi:hypothetical protein